MKTIARHKERIRTQRSRGKTNNLRAGLRNSKGIMMNGGERVIRRKRNSAREDDRLAS